MQYDISVIIPSLGDPESLQRVLRSLLAQKMESSKFEVLVILNGGARPPEKLYPPPVRFVTIPQTGANYARNRGIELAQGQILIFLDDDCEINEKYFLTSHVEFHGKNSSIFAYGGGYSLMDAAGFWDQVYNYMQMRWFFSGLNEKAGSDMQFLLGGNFSVKEKLLKDSGIFFDNAIVYGGTEYDFFMRANKAGLKMWMSPLDVLHVTHESLKSLTSKLYRQGIGKAIVESRHPQVKTVVSEFGMAEKPGIFKRLALIYFNYIFWLGYYRKKGRTLSILGHLAKEILNRVNFQRYRILRALNSQIEKKDD